MAIGLAMPDWFLPHWRLTPLSLTFPSPSTGRNSKQNKRLLRFWCRIVARFFKKKTNDEKNMGSTGVDIFFSRREKRKDKIPNFVWCNRITWII